MEKIAHVEISFLIDRGIKKVRINLMKNNRIFGFLVPVNNFEMGRWG